MRSKWLQVLKLATALCTRAGGRLRVGDELPHGTEGMVGLA